MKKINLLILVFGLLGGALSAQRFVFFTPQVPEISIKQTLDYNIIHDQKAETTGYSTVISADMKQLYSTFGISANSSIFDLTTQTIYWPTMFTNWKIGAGFKYHFYNRQREFADNDFLLDFYVSRPFFKGWFDFVFNCGLFWKVSAINIELNTDGKIKRQVLTVCDTSFDFGFVIDFYPGKNWKIWGSMATWSYFDYNLLHTMYFELGVERHLIDHLSFGVEMDTKWVDMITVAAVPNVFGIKVTGKVDL